MDKSAAKTKIIEIVFLMLMFIFLSPPLYNCRFSLIILICVLSSRREIVCTENTTINSDPDNYDFVIKGGPYNGYTYDGGIRTTMFKPLP